MELNEARARFEEVLASRGLGIQSLRPSDALQAVVSFYEDVRVEGCNLGADGDMLLFQWGTYDWGCGEAFELDLTWQFIESPEGEPEFWQLHLTFRFPPSPELRALSSGNQWCSNPSELPEFLTFVRASDPFTQLATQIASTTALTFETV